MQAIETRYKGYRFRSRLEARWAVFFDHIHVKWEYEPEGYKFDNGMFYLPDFYLREWMLWCEIKPVDYDNDAFNKGYYLVDQSSDKIVFLTGVPGDNSDYDYFDTHGGGTFTWELWLCDKTGFPIGLCEYVVRLAIEKSRSARFEFGESG